MYGYTLNENGRLVTYGSTEVEDPADYQTDVFAAKGAALIARLAPRAKPFFLSVAPLAPHYEHDLGNLPEPRPLPNPRPAPRHATAFADEALPRPPSYDEADVSDKPEGIREKARFPRACCREQTGRVPQPAREPARRRRAGRETDRCAARCARARATP